MNLKFILSGLLVSLSFSSYANNHLDEILNNSDITWAAEVFTYYTPNINSSQLGTEKMKSQYSIEGINKVHTLKIQNQIKENQIIGNPSSLAYRLLNLNPSEINMYKDSDMREQFNLADYKEIVLNETPDTIITFDSETYEEIIQVVINKIEIDKIQVFRLKQILHYNSKTHQFGVSAVAIAPISNRYNKKTGTHTSTPIFWMPVKETLKALDLNSSSLDWVKRIGRDIDKKDLKIIKGKQNIGEIFDAIIDHAINNSDEAKLYYPTNELSPLPVDAIKSIKSAADTVITFDPETFEEIIQVSPNKFHPENINKIRLIQNWIWDTKTQKMNIQLIAFAPVLVRYDNKGTYIFSSPVFYKKPNE
jgi:hypothetical protein